MFLLLLAVCAYVTYTLNMWGPMLSMKNAASAQALEEFKKRLREFLESTETGRQAIAMSDQDIPLRNMKVAGSGPAGQEADADDEDI